MQPQARLMMTTVVLAMGLTGCVKPPAAPTALPVSVTEVRFADTREGEELYSGSIAPGAAVPVAFTVGGYVREIMTVRDGHGAPHLLQQGDRVAQGAILAHIRDTDYQAQAAQAAAQVSGKAAVTEQAQYGRMQAVAALDQATAGINQATAAREQAQTLFTQAEASVAAAESQLVEAQAATQVTAAQQVQAEVGRDKAQADFARAERLYASQSLTRADYDAAQAQLRGSEAQVRAAQEQVKMAQSKMQQATVQIDANRAKMAQSKAAIAQSEAVISSAHAQQRAAEAAVNAAQAQVKAGAAGTRAAQAQSTQAQTPVGDAYLKSPLTGIVLQRTIELGTLVGPGTPGFVLADDATVKVVFGVSDVRVPMLHLGDPADIVAQAYAQRHFPGTITAIAPAADSNSHVFQVEVTPRNPDHLLKIGMIARVRLTHHAAAAQAHPTVPLSSIVPDPADANANTVFVVTTSPRGITQAHRRRVVVGDLAGNAITVVHGLAVGDRVITNGATLVRDGDDVTIVE